ncbi:MAG TPA: transcription-repair coupling factor [Candidatus Polarisedimenticolaceae bacterium]
MDAAHALFAPLVGDPTFLEIERRLASRAPRTAVAGLVEGARAVVLALLRARAGRQLLVVVPDDAAAESWRRDLAAAFTLAAGESSAVAMFPAFDADPWDDIAPHPEVGRERVIALSRLARREIGVLLVPARALLDPLPAPEEIAARVRVLRVGDALAPDRFVLQAIRWGYRRVDVVAAPGEVSRRGGIVDIFPVESEEPVRIELFGETIESLRRFDTDHQRSTGALDRAVVGAVIESPATDEAVERLARWIEDAAARARSADAPVLPLRERLEILRTEGYFPGLEALAALTASRPTDLFEHAPGFALVVDEPERVAEEIARSAHERRVAYEQAGTRILPPPDVLALDPRRVLARLDAWDLALQELRGDPPAGVEAALELPGRGARSYAGRLGELAGAVGAEVRRGVRVVCVMRTAGSARRLAEVFGEYALPHALAADDGAIPAEAWAPGGLFVVVGGLRHGFELPAQALVVLSEREIFGEEARPAERRTRSKAAFVSDFRDLRIGDLVVHVDHGVARYTGLGRPKGGSLNRDFMVLEFSGGDRLFVPVDRLDLVQKYSGVAGSTPTLDKLGGPGWERVKSRVRKSVESMAKELLELYARRRAATGHAFSPDTTWQGELEASFPYALTPDQVRALAEVKADMESPHPMDRLLVGDVGFGKTEVAVRAAFKAVMDGRQVALLAPTTVLAAQHHETLRERFAPFPVKVGMVSRFRSSGEVRESLRALSTGELDVVVGTHRLLSKDVSFRNLGLLVVDEEQRFGVADKERLKRLSLGIDVLSMTATPIPRTLQMSLAGVRDLSIIETPPPGRSAIQTYLIPFRKNVVAQAIRQELRRQGQVYFVHNRVETIPALVRALREMVPEARIVVGHGQMNDRELERVMLQFIHHEADVFVSTTIVENGLDIPAANTIVVNRADRFGLAQLYQLRGRVGRSEQRAYAYFLIPGRHVLTEVARRRLRALQEFSDLGSGFRLAAADLEIRGAGEFLGARQHGHIASLGFDLYTQMLERAVSELRGEAAPERAPATLHLGIDIKIPESFIPDVGDRLALYKRLSAARAEADVDTLQADTEDRRGHLPAAGKHLFDLARLRLVADRLGVRSVDLVEGRFQIRFHDAAQLDPARLVDLLARERGTWTSSGMMIVPAPSGAGERIRAAREMLERLGEAAA